MTCYRWLQLFSDTANWIRVTKDDGVVMLHRVLLSAYRDHIDVMFSYTARAAC